jgi:nucleotide-binding universal stress UspA family protein
MIKRILLPLDPSEYTKTATLFACNVAKRLDAEVSGMVVLDLPGIEHSVGPIPIGGSYYAEQVIAKKEVEAKARIAELIDEFAATCDRLGVRHCEFERQGVPGEKIVYEALYFDAVMMGMRTFFHFESNAKAGDSLCKVLDHSVTPVYAVPRTLPEDIFQRDSVNVLVAFDGSLPSARALQRFGQLALPNIMNITVLSSDKDAETAAFHTEQAANYLKSRGFDKVKTVVESDNIIDLIENKYLDQSDLFVVGAHSKRGLLDFFVGSLTEYLVELDKKPVLIGQ